MILSLARPTASAYGFYAYVMAILESRPEITRGWILSNFLQLCWSKEIESPVPFCFYFDDPFRNPFLFTVRLRSSDVPPGEVISFLKTALYKKSQYIFLNLDQHYLPRGLEANGEHFIHDSLIYGHSAQEGMFSLLAHNSKGQLQHWLVSESQIVRAYRAATLDQSADQRVILLSWQSGSYSLSDLAIRRTIEEYLNSENTSFSYALDHDPWERIYGVSIYEPLEEYVSGVLAGDLEFERKHAQVLLEHKRLEVQRLKVQKAPTPLIATAMLGAQYAQRLRDSLVKAQIRGDGSRYLESCLEDVIQLRTLDKEIFMGHLDHLATLRCGRQDKQ